MILFADRELNVNKESLRVFALNAAIVIVCLWFLRNKIIHDGVEIDLGKLLATIKKGYMDHYIAWSSVEKQGKLRWVPPVVGWLKLNTDVAIRPNRSFITISI